MIPSYSAKRPYTVFVAVVLIIVLGVISFFGMTTDLLPTFELPYILVITTYPGASPEKVELEVTAPLEAALGTAGGLNNMTSTSSENMSMITLEFVQETNMDSATIEVSNSIDLVKGSLPETVSAPMFLQMSADMLPIMVASVDMGLDTETADVVQYVEETVIPAFERISGVASVTASGLVEPKLKVELDDDKIALLNKQFIEDIESSLDEAYDEISATKYDLEEAQEELSGGAGSPQDELAKANAGLTSAISTLNAMLAEKQTLEIDKAAFEGEKSGMEGIDTFNKAVYTPLLVGSPSSGAMPAIPGFFENALFLQPLGPLPTGHSITSFTQLTEAQFTQTIGAPPNSIQYIWEQVLSTPMPDPNNSAATTTMLKVFQEFGVGDPLTHKGMVAIEAMFAFAPTRVAELEAELRNIDTRLMVLSAMEPELTSGLNEAQSGFEQVVSGQMELTIGLADAQTQILIGLNSIEQVLNDFDATRDSTLEQADLTNIITEDMINGILTANNFSMPAGYIEDDTGEYLVKVGDVYDNIDEIENTLLMSLDATGDIFIGDVASVSLENVSDGSYAKVNGAPGIILQFQKQSTVSTTAVTDEIEDVIETLEQNGDGVRVVPLMNQGDYIDMIVNSVIQNLLYGGLLAIFVLLFFLRNIKPTIIIAFSIPISLMFSITLMYFTDVTLNIISLSGLALGVGMLVDNSIVVIENIYRMRHTGVPAKTAAVEGAKQVMGAITASTLTTICVFLPIVFTDGISRQLFTDMGLTIAYSLVTSLIVALTLVPAMSSLMLENVGELNKKTMFDKLIEVYAKSLAWSLKHKSVVLIFVLSLLALAIIGTTIMGTAFMPEMGSPQMSATLTIDPDEEGVDLFSLSDQYASQILSIDGVEYVGAMDQGSAGFAGMGGGGNSISYYILLSEDSPFDNKAVEKLIYEKTAFLKGEISVQASTMDMSMMTGSGIQIVLKSNDLDELIAESGRIAQIMGTVEGVGEVTTGYEDADNEIRITVDKEKAMRKGLTVAQVYSEIASALTLETDSTVVSSGNDNFPVVIVTEGSSLTVESLPYFAIELSTDETAETPSMSEDEEDEDEEEDDEDDYVLLKDIATITEETTVPSINRDNLARYSSISATIADGYNIGHVSQDVERALSGYTPPDGATVETEGENEMINDALSDLVLMVLLAIVFIYLIMVAQFQSVLSPFIVLFTLPLAFTGGLLLLWICGMELSVVSMLGFLVLAGVVVNNGIVFVDYTNQLRESGLDIYSALIETGRSRIRPILMTALTTVLAMSTMALGMGQGAEMTQPMAVVTIGGLMYATLLTLYVVPSIYALIHDRKSKRNKRNRRG